MKKGVCIFALSICAVVSSAMAQSVSVSVPGKSWQAQISDTGFTVKTSNTKPDGRAYLLAENAGTGMVASITLEKAPGADAKTCPAFLRKRIAGLQEIGLKDVSYSTAGEMAVAEYLVPSLNGIPVTQRNLIACGAKDDVYIDLHLSKVNFKPEDEELFAALLAKLSFVPITEGASRGFTPATSSTPALAESSKSYFAIGSRFFLEQNYSAAIAPYEKALALEKARPALEKNRWRVLVDNLGMSYGITGNLDAAEATFRYGLSKDPDYPMFSYNMACVYGERNDLQTTLSWLKRAFDNRGNSIPGESMPDPRTDNSFARFVGNPKFESFVKSIK